MSIADRLIERAQRTPFTHISNSDGNVYMYRWWLVPYPGAQGDFPVGWFGRLLQRLGISVRVHEIMRSDRGRHPHGHPWNFVTVILRGGYLEHRFDEQGKRRSSTYHTAGTVLFRRPTDYHYIQLPGGEAATTLFVTGRKRRTWGFIVEGQFVPHQQYEGEP